MRAPVQIGRALGWVVVTWLTFAGGLAAQLSPGPLAEVHQELEGSKNCLQCHSSERGVDPDLCLACHTLLAERVSRGVGLHARPEYADCKSCHIDHHGREFELVWWGDEGMEAFDHRLTGWDLGGAHRELGCRDCHRASHIEGLDALRAAGKSPDQSFLGLDTDCLACHRDEHRGQFAGQSCLSCHEPDDWIPAAGFDHARARFVLTGGHEQVSCESCHFRVTEPSGGESFVRFRGLAFAACSDCHQDPHAGRFGATCETCHDTRSWRRVERSGFDHDLTSYPLRGRHRDVACESCHRSGRVLQSLAFDRCTDCHEDEHAGQLARRADRGACEACHTVDGFRPSGYTLAEHDGVFALEGAHRALQCVECHAEVESASLVAEGLADPAEVSGATLQRFRFTSLGCLACHRDPHMGTAIVSAAGSSSGESSCQSCHDSTAWSAVTFDHRSTGFQLGGAHSTLACAACHEGRAESSGEPVSLAFSGLGTECVSCHQDRHFGQFASGGGEGTSCQRCHDLEAWIPVTGFDHSIDAAFSLEGAHLRVECDACHRTGSTDGVKFVRYRPLASACADCHR